MKQQRSYGFPWTTFTSSRSRFAIDPHAMGPDSINALINPLEGNFHRRGGTSATGIGATTGTLEMVIADATMKSFQVDPMVSPSLSDGYPTWAVQWGDESKHFGQVGFRSSNSAGSDQVEGKSFGGTHYSHTTTTINHFRMIPMPYVHNAVGYSRCAFEQNRRYMSAGSRRFEQVGADLQKPNFFAAPYRNFRRRFNDTSGAGTESEVHLPLGHIPGMWAPTVVAGTGSASVRPWAKNQQFYVAIAYMDETGAISMPSTPRAVNTTLTTGLGLVTLGTGSDYYEAVTWTIPIGPPGTRARIGLRSPSVLSTAAPYVPPDPLDMRVAFVIQNNTATTYSDSGGSDGGLLIDAERIRWDHRRPRPARWAWTFDQRLALGDLAAESPAAMYLAPTGSVASRDLNAADDSQLVYGSVTFEFIIQPTRLRLRKSSGGATTSQNIALAAGTTLQQIVDTINATTTASAGGEWCAQLALDADGNAPSTMLAPTSQNVVCATTINVLTVTSAALFGPVAVGTRVTGTGITAGTYVKSIESTSSLTLSVVATATNSPVTLTFYSDVDDDYIITANPEGGDGNIDKNGNQRVICAALPGLAAFSKTYIDQFQPNPQAVMFTGASPGHAPNAANNFYVANSRTLPSHLGTFVAAGHVSNGNIVSICAYSEGVGVIRNLRGGGTALDSDYRLLATASRRGCISPMSFVQGNGWCGWLSHEGYVMSDGEREVVVSPENYVQTETGGIGEWSYEIEQSAAAVASGATTWGFCAKVVRGVLWVSYRRDATHRMVQSYDFSAGFGASGLDEVLRPDGGAWGWSSPLAYNWNNPADTITSSRVNAIGAVRKSDGLYLIGADDSNDATNCGLVARFENGTFTDGTTRVTGQVNTLTDRCGTHTNKHPQRARHMYAAPGVAESVVVNRLLSRASGATLTLPVTTQAYAIKGCEIPQRERTATKQVEQVISFGSVGSSSFKHWGCELEVEVTTQDQGGG